jgi:predicted TIM-barrel fold metal-dependent hydrolase
MLIRPDAPEAMRVYAWCGEVGIPVFWHCGPAGIEPKASQARAQVAFYERPIAECPGTTFILGHSGALQHRQALTLQKKYPNAYLDISSLGLPQLDDLLREGDVDRILFGSDWPFYHPVLPLAKVLVATEDRREVRRKILYENAARLMERFGQPK